MLETYFQLSRFKSKIFNKNMRNILEEHHELTDFFFGETPNN